MAYYDYNEENLDYLGTELLDISKYNTRTEQLDANETLLLAILETAIFDYTRYLNANDQNQHLLWRAAFEYFFNEHDPLWLGDFEVICTQLNISPTNIRKALIHFTKMKYKDEKAEPPEEITYVLQKDIQEENKVEADVRCSVDLPF